MKAPRRASRLRLASLLSLSCLAALPTLVASVAQAQGRLPQEQPTKPQDKVQIALNRFRLGIERLTLENGLRLVLAPDHNAKTVAVSVTYGVGSRDEGPGQSGFAHLFEHMMFQGSEHVAKGQHFTLISERGGSLNGTTSSDRTNYFEVLPSSELALALWLEADRMRALAVNAENFENQRAVVKEEYRMRYENAPYMTGMMRMGELIFADYPPYTRPTIGSMADLDAAKLEWVKTFYDSHYAPKNAVLTITGDFESDDAVKLARQYFGKIDKPVAPRAQLPAMPDKVTPRKDVVKDSNAKTPGFYFGYMIPPVRTEDHYALELAVAILADGESSRLERILVRDRAVAQRVSAWTRDYVGADELSVNAVLTEKSKLADVEKLVEEQIAELAKKPVTDAELGKVKTRIRSSYVFGLQTNLNRATRLGEYESYFGDARLLGMELLKYQSVTAQEIQAAVKKYLGPERRQLVEVVPVDAVKPADAKPPATKTPDAKAPTTKTPDAKPATAAAPKTPPAPAKAPATKAAADVKGAKK